MASSNLISKSVSKILLDSIATMLVNYYQPLYTIGIHTQLMYIILYTEYRASRATLCNFTHIHAFVNMLYKPLACLFG